MAKIEQAVRWFENIADECDRLTSENVSQLKTKIKGIAWRSAEYLKKHGKETAFKVGDRIRIKGSCAKGDVIKNIYFDGMGLMFEFEGNSDDSPVDRDWELVNEQVMHVSNHLFDECVSNVPDWVMKETSDKMDAMIAKEDLEKEIARYEESIYGFESSSRDDCIGIAKHFAEYGARMQREQMMKGAISGFIFGSRYFRQKNVSLTNLSEEQYDKLQDFGERVKVIILPSDNKND